MPWRTGWLLVWSRFSVRLMVHEWRLLSFISRSLSEFIPFCLLQYFDRVIDLAFYMKGFVVDGWTYSQGYANMSTTSVANHFFDIICWWACNVDKHADYCQQNITMKLYDEVVDKDRVYGIHSNQPSVGSRSFNTAANIYIYILFNRERKINMPRFLLLSP